MEGFEVTLNDIQELAKQAEELSHQITEKTEELSVLKEQLKDILEHKLPDMLESLGMEEIRLSSGAKIKLERQIFGKFPKDPEDVLTVLEYLERMGSSSLLKRTYEIPAKVESEKLKAITETLKQQGISFTTKESIHPQTFNKFVRECIETESETFPRTAFGVVEVTTTKLL